MSPMYSGTVLTVFRIASAVVVLGSIFIRSSLSHETVVPVAVGQTAKLQCLVEITGSINVEWMNPLHEVLTLNNQVLTQDQRFSIHHPYVKEWNLEIRNVRSSDAGEYRCRIGIGQLPEITRSVKLTITIPPEIISVSGDESYVLNSTATLSCVAKGIPEPEITWQRVGHDAPIELNVKNSNYVIESVNLSTAGSYECHAANGVLPMAKRTLVVYVLFAPMVKVPYREVIQGQGEWTQLSCHVTTNPAAELYWMRNGRRVGNLGSYVVASQEEIDRYRHIMRLSIGTLGYSDFGEYVCFAENKYGKDGGRIRLLAEQRNKVLVIGRPRDITATVGEDVLFNCSVLNLPKDSRLTWWHRVENHTKKLFEFPSLQQNSTPERTANSLEKHDIVGQYDLLIRKTSIGDQGLYTCQITGHENLSATLDVISIRDPSFACGESHRDQAPFSPNSMLIVLSVVVVVLLVVAIVIVVFVCRRQLLLSQNNGYLHSEQRNSKDGSVAL